MTDDVVKVVNVLSLTLSEENRKGALQEFFDSTDGVLCMCACVCVGGGGRGGEGEMGGCALL